MKIKKAIFPAGGLGTRFLPATKIVPKEMLPAFNKPMIQYAIEEAKNAGIEEFLFIVSRGKTAIEDHFDISFELEHKLLTNNKKDYHSIVVDSVPNIGTTFFIRQQQPLGLGHAIFCAKNFINKEPFAIILPDELIVEKEDKKSSLKEMISLFEEKKGKAVVMATKQVPKDEVSAYGVFNIESQNGNIIKAKGIVEKPAVEDSPSDYVSIGRYIMPPEILDVLEKSKPTVNNEIQLTDAIDVLLQEKELYAYIVNADRFDCGNPLGLLEASIAMGLKDSNNYKKIKDILKRYS